MWYILSERSNQWSVVRKEHLKKEPHCMACGSVKKLEVHHIEPFHINPERELDLTNLITLCSSCHLTFGHLMDYTSWNSSVREDTSVYYQKVINRPHKIVTQNVKTISDFIRLTINSILRLFWNYRP